ncbi:uncharacterized protein A1O5_07979 [Cladophialophora psammophila CBS 110553]|uniref:Uncharacterized protein n=1 Tax=Cladophialophora psammophila CBS 110553 TaxID=1182543 RepID=W9XF87_9EURO|nr:uncharacterized protein A1O5_07979 [Cladophialophora psammophila CBS 110553]EXJ69044.1 hypothetical protein A1O5_07979 [Cladophialophora psammophila CBS 110553]
MVGKDGQYHYYLNYEIRVGFFSARMDFSLWYLDKQYGKIEAEFFWTRLSTSYLPLLPMFSY